MNEDQKAFIVYATVVVFALLSLWLGFRLVEALVPFFVDVIRGLLGLVWWMIAFALLIVTAILTVVMPLIVGAALVSGLFWIADVIARQAEQITHDLAELKRSLSAQARDAAVDAAFLAALGLFAALVFFVGTGDFIEPFAARNGSGPSHEEAQTVRVLAVAGAACSIGKILFLIPARSAKIIAIILSAVALSGTAIFVYETYFLEIGLSGAWSNIRRSSIMSLFVMVIALSLLLVALAYPFTLRGWRRMWRVEMEKPVLAA